MPLDGNPTDSSTKPAAPTTERTTGMGGHHSARAMKDEWLTPRWITDLLGPFDLDPCSPIERPWDTAVKHYTILDDGLKQPWHGHVWLNPPYGRETGRWMDRLAAHPDGGMALIFARTETDMFFEHVWGKANALLFLRGRLHFHHANGTRARANAGAPSVLVAYGTRAICDLMLSGIDGQFLRLK